MRLPRLPELTPRFSAREQIVAILWAHALILIVVTAIMVLGENEFPPWELFAGEGLILALCISILVDFSPIADFRLFRGLQAPIRRLLEGWREKTPPMVFGAIFLLQFAALTPLLQQTGGPLVSPFGQLALAFAVFPPILANKLRTMLIAVFSSVLYIAIMVMTCSDMECTTPDKEVFIAVTALVLGTTVGLAILDRWDSDDNNRDSFSANPWH